MHGILDNCRTILGSRAARLTQYTLLCDVIAQFFLSEQTITLEGLTIVYLI